MLSIPTEIKKLSAELAFTMARGDDSELVDPMLNAVGAFLAVPVADVLPNDDADPVARARKHWAWETFDDVARILNPISPRYETAKIILALATEYLTRGDRGTAIGTIRDQVVFEVDVVTVLATQIGTEAETLVIEWQAIGRDEAVVKSGRTEIPNDEMQTPTTVLFLDACRNEIILRELNGVGEEPDYTGADVVDHAVEAFATTHGKGYYSK